jgi:hypothetical protein
VKLARAHYQHTHRSNAPLLRLAQRWGFVTRERKDGPWPSIDLDFVLPRATSE